MKKLHTMNKLLTTTIPAVLLAATALFRCDALRAQELRILVGTYTENTPAEGIYLYSFDTATADASLLSKAPAGNPTFLTVSPDGKFVYSVNEFGNGREGVSSFTLEGDRLSCLNSVNIPTDGMDGRSPCNILHTGGAIITSNYSGGSVNAFALGRDGAISGVSQYFTPFPDPAPGTKNPARMHCAVPSPDGKYIFVTDLGQDCIHRFEKGEGAAPLGRETVAWQHGGRVKFGPRHMVFSEDGRFAYLLCELGDKLVVFSYDDGSLTPVQTLSAYKGKGHGSADIHISPDGRFLYTSHRLKDEGIAIFSIDPDSGKVRKAGYTHSGRHPRNFAISPDGNWLLCGCRDDNRIEIYSIDKASGALSPSGKSIEAGAPVCIKFLQ